VSRLVILLALATACQPKQPLQPSFFTKKPDANAPASCTQTLACYDACSPLTEECMLLCDQKSEAHAVDRARKVSYCSAEHGCAGDRGCTDERCAEQVRACVSPVVAPAPSQMRPQSYPGQVGGPTPTQPQPYPGQQPAGYPPPPPGYPSPPPPPSYRPPPPPPPGYPPR